MVQLNHEVLSHHIVASGSSTIDISSRRRKHNHEQSESDIQHAAHAECCDEKHLGAPEA